MADSTAMDLSRYNDVVGRIRGLLERWLESGIDLFIELRKVEQDGDWKAPGCATFSDFLRQEFPTTLGIDRYTNVIKALDVYGIEFIRKVGIAPCHALTVDAIIKDPSRIALVRRTVEEKIDRTRCAIDDNAARKIVRGIAPETVTPVRDTLRVMRYDLLQTELRTANVELRALKKENAALKKELETVRAQIASGAKKRGKKSSKKKGE